MHAQRECRLPSRKHYGKPGSGSLAVLEHELELGQNHVPISTPCGSVFDNFSAGQIEHFAQGIVVGETGLISCDLAELAVQAFDDIGHVYDFPNLSRICEKGAQNIPIILPAFDTGEPDRKFCVKTDKRQSKEQVQIRSVPDVGTDCLNSA